VIPRVSSIRRSFFEALTDEPTGAAEALEQIKTLYAIEEQIRDRKPDPRPLHGVMPYPTGTC
jgi:Transposase IS66 family